MRSKLLGALFCLMVFLAGVSALARSHKHPHGLVVTSVDAADKKIVLMLEKDKQAMPYSISLGATLTIDQSPVALKQIHKGMHVISYTEADEHVLSQLDVERGKK